MAECNKEALQAEQSLAHLLEFLAQLENKTEVKKRVITEIEKKVKAYTSNELDDFADEDADSGYLPMTISKSKELRTNIVKSEEKYGHYKESFQGEDDTDKCAEHLIDNIFAFFGCLYYMYFECSNECSGIEGGGKWWAEQCDGSGSGQKKHLSQWLKDETGTSTGRMIQRGFKEGELSEKTGNDLFPPRDREQSESLLDYQDGAQLQNALYYMLFLPTPDKWNNAQSGHAVLFLEAFCKKVTGGQFDGQYKEADAGQGFKAACKDVTEKIDTLIGLKIIAPVACYQEVKYTNLLQPKHFWSYVSWLKGILDKLITSLAEMASDASKWKKEGLKDSKTFGPYPWGFTFEYNWESKTGQLNTPLQNLNTALSSFKDALKSISKREGKSENPAEKSSTSTASTAPNDSTASTVSTLGSVIGGLGGLGATAGAAYAGSGILGPAAEGVGKFVRGLFF